MTAVKTRLQSRAATCSWSTSCAVLALPRGGWGWGSNLGCSWILSHSLTVPSQQQQLLLAFSAASCESLCCPPRSHPHANSRADSCCPGCDHPLFQEQYLPFPENPPSFQMRVRWMAPGRALDSHSGQSQTPVHTDGFGSGPLRPNSTAPVDIAEEEGPFAL